MIKAVVFDLDDTLLQTREVKWNAIKIFGQDFYQHEISSETLKKHWGKPFRQFMSEIFDNPSDLDDRIEKYKSFIIKFKNKPYPNALETLEKLFPHYMVCILSSAAQSLVFRDMESAGLPIEKFTYIQSEEDTSVHKPDPSVFEPLIRILSEHQIKPSEMFYTGDTLYDFQAATGAGLHFRGLANRTISQSEFDNAGAKTILQLSEIVELLPTL